MPPKAWRLDLLTIPLTLPRTRRHHLGQHSLAQMRRKGLKRCPLPPVGGGQALLNSTQGRAANN